MNRVRKILIEIFLLTIILSTLVHLVLAQKNETNDVLQQEGVVTPQNSNISEPSSKNDARDGGLLESLNKNSGAINVIFSGLVALATIVYAYLTMTLVSETRKMREAQTEPNICVTIQPSDVWINFIDMFIQNIGLGPAYNIQFEINPDFEYEKGKFLSELGFMRNGFKFLAPNQRFKFFLTNLLESYDKKIIVPETSEEKTIKHETFEDKMGTHFDIKVKYQNSLRKNYVSIYCIDFSHLVGLSQVGELPIYKISENIEAIQKDIHNLSTGSKMKVVVYTKTEDEKDKKQKLEQAKKQLEQRNRI